MKPLFTLAALCVAAAFEAAPAAATASREVRDIIPPESGYYARVVDCGGIPVKGSAKVSDAALLEAARRIDRLLANLPQVRANLVAAGAQHHVIAKDDQTSDLPEWRQMKGKKHWDGSPSFDARVRGMGGVISSSGEDNLLKLPTDRYKDHRDICSHEFAHGILQAGVSREVAGLFDVQRERSVANGLWKSYAGTNAHEFFAELTMWYFGTRGDYGEITPRPQPGRAWLRSYDPDAFTLLDDFYSGRLQAKPAPREESSR